MNKSFASYFSHYCFSINFGKNKFCSGSHKLAFEKAVVWGKLASAQHMIWESFLNCRNCCQSLIFFNHLSYLIPDHNEISTMKWNWLLWLAAYWWWLIFPFKLSELCRPGSAFRAMIIWSWAIKKLSIFPGLTPFIPMYEYICTCVPSLVHW